MSIIVKSINEKAIMDKLKAEKQQDVINYINALKRALVGQEQCTIEAMKKIRELSQQ